LSHGSRNGRKQSNDDREKLPQQHGPAGTMEHRIVRRRWRQEEVGFLHDCHKSVFAQSHHPRRRWKKSFRDNLLLPLVGIGNLEIIRKTYGLFVDCLNEHHKITSKPPPGVRITNCFEKEGEGDKHQFDWRWQEPIPTNRPEFKDLISQHDHMNCMRSILVCVSN